MKHLLIFLFSILLIGGLFIQCGDQQTPTSISDESNATLNKATVVEYTFDYDCDLDPPLTNCVTGAPMQAHGVIKGYVRELTTPSGNWTSKGYADYNAYGGITLENLSTGEIWTNKNGTNPWKEIEIHNGSYRFHYHVNEVYALGNQTLHIRLKGFFTVDKNGNVTKYLETYSCK